MNTQIDDDDFPASVFNVRPGLSSEAQKKGTDLFFRNSSATFQNPHKTKLQK